MVAKNGAKSELRLKWTLYSQLAPSGRFLYLNGSISSRAYVKYLDSSAAVMDVYDAVGNSLIVCLCFLS